MEGEVDKKEDGEGEVIGRGGHSFLFGFSSWRGSPEMLLLFHVGTDDGVRVMVVFTV